MMQLFKTLLANTCPDCNQALLTAQDGIGYIKSCPQGHYKEEMYPVLGVKISYHEK